MSSNVPDSSAKTAPDLHVATLGYIYDGCNTDGFYGAQTTDGERLKHYSSVLDAILIKSTFYGQPKTEVYQQWLDITKENAKFKFILSSPKGLTTAGNELETRRIWDFFWKGYNRRGGCKVLHDAHKLGCIFIELPTTFCCAKRSVSRILYLMDIIPTDIRVAVEFKHWSWWERRKLTEAVFSKRANWCMVTPYVENGMVNSGWAGTLPSSRIHGEETVPVYITTDFAFINLYGTLGKSLGSYDENLFLEKLARRLTDMKTRGVETIFCTFSNTESSYCYPLPCLFLMGVPVKPKIKELAQGMLYDLPCGLHDAQQLKKIWNEMEGCPYKLDKEGYIEIKF